MSKFIIKPNKRIGSILVLNHNHKLAVKLAKEKAEEERKRAEHVKLEGFRRRAEYYTNKKLEISEQCPSAIKRSHIFEFDFGVRVNNRLSEYGVEYFGDLMYLTEDFLLKIPGLGRASLYRIKGEIALYGFSLSKDPESILKFNEICRNRVRVREHERALKSLS